MSQDLLSLDFKNSQGWRTNRRIHIGKHSLSTFQEKKLTTLHFTPTATATHKPLSQNNLLPPPELYTLEPLNQPSISISLHNEVIIAAMTTPNPTITILADRDVNANTVAMEKPAAGKDIKSLDQFRQDLLKKVEDGQYVLPSHPSPFQQPTSLETI